MKFVFQHKAFFSTLCLVFIFYSFEALADSKKDLCNETVFDESYSGAEFFGNNKSFGESCLNNAECGDGGTCVASICTYIRSYAEKCDDSADCKPGLSCKLRGAKKRCYYSSNEDEFCLTDVDCNAPYFCLSDNKCNLKKSRGEQCGASYDCLSENCIGTTLRYCR